MVRLCLVIILVMLISVGVNGLDLFCYRCLRIDCSHEDPECHYIESFAKSKLKDFYYVDDGNYLEPCPPINSTLSWTHLQVVNEPCPSASAHEPACAVGQIQIVSKYSIKWGKLTTKKTYAAVMGCAKRQVVRLIAGLQEGQHDLLAGKSTDDGVERHLYLAHFRGDACSQKDYCLDRKQSSIKPAHLTWNSSDQDNAGFNYFWLIIGFGIVAAAVLLYGVYCGLPRCPPTLPKIICYKGKVEKIDADEPTSIEVQEQSSNETPLVPAPPPQRPMIRESSPV